MREVSNKIKEMDAEIRSIIRNRKYIAEIPNIVDSSILVGQDKKVIWKLEDGENQRNTILNHFRIGNWRN